jgi:hypothetical protein
MSEENKPTHVSSENIRESIPFASVKPATAVTPAASGPNANKSIPFASVTPVAQAQPPVNQKPAVKPTEPQTGK